MNKVWGKFISAAVCVTILGTMLAGCGLDYKLDDSTETADVPDDGQYIVVGVAQVGMKKELEPSQVAVGAKETIKLSEEIINERFGLKAGEGTAWLSAGRNPRRRNGENLNPLHLELVGVGVSGIVAGGFRGGGG